MRHRPESHHRPLHWTASALWDAHRRRGGWSATVAARGGKARRGAV